MVSLAPVTRLVADACNMLRYEDVAGRGLGTGAPFEGQHMPCICLLGALY